MVNCCEAEAEANEGRLKDDMVYRALSIRDGGGGRLNRERSEVMSHE
jgi:hypothetical protein